MAIWHPLQISRGRPMQKSTPKNILKIFHKYTSPDPLVSIQKSALKGMASSFWIALHNVTAWISEN